MRSYFSLFLLLLLPFFMNSPSYGQEEAILRINVQKDRVFIYHNKTLLPGHGFNIYRKIGTGIFNKLNEEPVTGVLYPEELPQALGENYPRLEELTGTSSPAAIFFRLRSNKVTGKLAAFLWPEVALSLGRLYIDQTAPIGQEVIYRLEFLNDRGEPSGAVLEKKLILQLKEIAPPKDLAAENTGRQVTLSWQYPRTSIQNDDQVIQFHVYRTLVDAPVPEKIHESIIIRNNAQLSHQLTFEANQTGQYESYFVTAVDITGKESSPSRSLRYLIEDNIPPQVISGVNAFSTGRAISINWNTATDPDVAGYNLYRSERMNGNYQRINTSLLEPLQTIYADSSIRQGKNFSYKVSAVDHAGNESPLSLAAIARIQDTRPPESVQHLTAEYNGKEVELSWAPVKESSSFRSYLILRNMQGDGNKAFSKLNQEDLRETKWKDPGMAGKGFKEGAIYQYGVITTDSAHNFSDTTTFLLQIPDHTPPAPPTNTQAINENGLRVHLTWNASSSADAVSYKVYKQALPSGPEVLVEVLKEKRAFRDEEVRVGQKYLYRITAMDSLENESEFSLSDTIWVRDFDPPRQVRNVRAIPQDSGVTIYWEPVEGFDLQGYRVYTADIPTGRYRLLNEQLVEATEWKEPQAKPDMWYRVRAVDSSGNESKPSEAKKAQPQQ